MKTICKIKDCNKPHSARGWCHMHYNRDRRLKLKGLSYNTSHREAKLNKKAQELIQTIIYKDLKE